MSKNVNGWMCLARNLRVAGIFWFAAVCAVPAVAQVEPPAQTESPAVSAKPPAAKVEVDRAQIEKRLEAVDTLLERSSAARQIEANGDVRALEKRARARAIRRQALEAFQAGEYPKASQLLSEASMQMFEAVRLAAPEQLTAEKMRRDFESRLQSVKSLLAAQKRISVEKTDVPGSAEASRTIEKLLQEAGDLAAAGKLEQGRSVLDQAYLAAKAAISSMRSGDTLVRSLNFATKEDEYHYEIDRNDTHQMLIKILLEEKRNVQGMEQMLKGLIDKAVQLRGEAEAAAARRDYADAIRLLEESTRQLVRAIRGAGIYIPG